MRFDPDTLIIKNSDGIPSGWTIGNIEDLIGLSGLFCDGDWIETKDQDPNGDVRLIQLADIGDGNYRNKSSRFLTKKKADELNCTYIENGDLLIARLGEPLGKTCIFPGDDKIAVTAVDVCIVRTGNGNIPHKWIMYSINSPIFRRAIANLQSGTTRKRISRKNLARIKFPIPPLNEQDRIVFKLEELFTRLDAGVEALKQVQELLKRYRQSILKSAVEGKLTSKWHEQHKDELEPADKLLERILKERKEKWEAEQLANFKAKDKTPPKNWQNKYKEPLPPDTNKLPELPDGWVWATNDHVSFVTKLAGFEYTKYVNYDPSGDVPVIKAENVTKNGFVKTKFSYVVNDTVKHLKRSKIKADDLLMVFVGAGLGQVGIVPSENEYFLGPNVAMIRIESNFVLPIFFELFFRSPTGYGLTLSLSKATAQGSISMTSIRQIPCAIPSIKEQRVIIETTEKLLSIIDETEKGVEAELKRSQSLHRSILKRAFEGKLVPQDPNDEPASVLLERIKAEKSN